MHFYEDLGHTTLRELKMRQATVHSENNNQDIKACKHWGYYQFLSPEPKKGVAERVQEFL
jgi:hypothetical protein